MSGHTLPKDAIDAAAREAHRRGKLVFAHPQRREGLMVAVQGGADVLVHTAPDAGPWDDTIVSSMKKAGVALISPGRSRPCATPCAAEMSL